MYRHILRAQIVMKMIIGKPHRQRIFVLDVCAFPGLEKDGVSLETYVDIHRSQLKV